MFERGVSDVLGVSEVGEDEAAEDAELGERSGGGAPRSDAAEPGRERNSRRRGRP